MIGTTAEEDTFFDVDNLLKKFTNVNYINFCAL